MRVLCIHPSNTYNIGDMMTYLGSRYLLQQAIDDIEFVQFDIERAVREIDTYISQYNWGDIDLILLAGAPWLTYEEDISNPRPLRTMLTQAIARYPKAKKIALGLGAFLAHQFMYRVRKVDFNISPFETFDLIVTRDVFANLILHKYGVDNILYYDTAIYSYFSLPSKPASTRRNILIYYDPLVNDPKDHLPKEVWERYLDYQLEWAKANNAMIIGIDSGDISSAMKHGVECRFVADLDWLARAMAVAPKVLSGRVHQAILAQIMGCPKVQCLPVDSRYTSALNIGVDIVTPFPFFEIDRYKKLDFELSKLRDHTYEKYVIDLLRGVLL